MEITSVKSTAFTNYEVMQKLKQIRAATNVKKGQLATITYEALCYLEGTPCREQTSESIINCLNELRPFEDLKECELLMLINTPPKNAIELQFIINDSEERLTEDQVDKIIKIVARNFPHINTTIEDVDMSE